jgi:guanylate kinase
VRFLLLLPPSLAVLERRLRERGTDKEDAIGKRMESAGREVKFVERNHQHADKPVYDQVVVNDELEKAYAERLREGVRPGIER